MNPLIKKEIRLLLPAWTVALLLAVISPWFFFASISDGSDSVFCLLFSIGVLLLGISSFGQELSSGAFTILLSQPFERRRLWRTKITALAVAFFAVWFAAVVSFLCQFHIVSQYRSGICTAGYWAEYKADTLEIITLASFAAFSGGLWAILLLRQITAAIWLAFLVPTAIFFTISFASNYFLISNQAVNLLTVIVLAAYSIAGFFWARHLFLRAQDLQWTGGEISFEWRRKSGVGPTVAGRPRHWLLALVSKEILLQQINLLIAIVLFFLQIACDINIILKIHPHFHDPNVAFILEAFGAIWLVMPLLIGASAIAEEQKLGILDSQKCLPASRNVQLTIKFFSAFLLSLLLGGLVPFLIGGEIIAHSIIFIIAAALFLVSFYGSSLARSTLQAMGLAILLASTIISYSFLTLNFESPFGLGLSELYYKSPFGLGLLELYLGSFILAIVLALLTIRNFKWLHETAKLRRQNIIALLAAFASIFVLSHGIYFRAWELLAPLQPPPGPVRLSNPAAIKLAANEATIYATLPDGRLWTETIALDTVSNQDSELVAPDRSHVQFVAGSNWTDVASDIFQAVAIRSDGTLWSLQRQWNPFQDWWNQTGPFIVTQIGSDTDWSQAAGARSMGFLLLKENGRLSVWGTNGYDWKTRSRSLPKKLKRDLAALPASLGTGNTWTQLVASGHSAFARKNDGTVWEWTAWADEKHSTMVQNTNLNGQWSSFRLFGDSFVGIKTNGELWFTEPIGGAAFHNARVLKIHLGEKEKWKTVTDGYWESLFAIRDDGTLWKWPIIWDIDRDRFLKPVQLGDHSNWVTFINTWQGAYALASDGSLWFWDQPSAHIWLARSRRPVYIGNIFQAAPATPAASQ